MSSHSSAKKTLRTLYRLKAESKAAAAVTAYDFPSAKFADQADVDWILVGDSGGMTVLGYESTISVSMEEMLHFACAVGRAKPRAFVVGDMPFLSYQISNEEAVRNAGLFLSKASCDAVKLEGGQRMSARISCIVDAGIPVMAHLGLTPQSLSMQGGYRVHGKSTQEFLELITDAKSVEAAGASFILLEAVPTRVASLVRQSVKIPVYGIGAGSSVDGQLLILHDLIGAFVGTIQPKFARAYAQVGASISSAIRNYCADVRERKFPSNDETYAIEPQALDEILLAYGQMQSPHLPGTREV